MTPDQVMAIATAAARTALEGTIAPPARPSVGDTFEVYGRTIRIVAVHETTIDVVVDAIGMAEDVRR